jgi:hypothetical protein
MLDPITTAILAGIAMGAKAVGEKALVDAYAALRTLIRRKYGANSELEKSIQSVEVNPASQARRHVLQEEVYRARAADDPELKAAARRLGTLIINRPNGSQVVQTIENGGWIVGRDVNVGPGGSFVGGDWNQSVNVDPYSSKTNFGCAFMTLGFIVAIAGFAYGAFTVYELSNEELTWESDRGMPPEFLVAGGLFLAGIVLAFIGKIIDDTLTRRR